MNSSTITREIPHTLEQAALIPCATWFYRQDGVEVNDLTPEGLAALVRLGYVQKEAVIGSVGGIECALAQDSELFALLTSPFAGLPALNKPEFGPPAPIDLGASPHLATRFLALMFDSLLMGGVMAVLGLINILLAMSFNVNYFLLWLIAWFVSSSLYFGLSESGEHQASLGQRIMGFKVVSQTHKPIGRLRGLWRGMLKTASIVILPISGLVAMSSKDKRALHDLLAQTQVVKND